MNNHLNKIEPSDYKYFGLWKCNPFADYFWVSWFDKTYLEQLGIPITESGALALQGGNFFLKNKVIEQATRFTKEKIAVGDLTFINNFTAFNEKFFGETVARSERAARAATDTEFISETVRINRDLMFGWFLGWLFSEIYESDLEAAAKASGIDIDKISDFIPALPTPLTKQREELFAIKQQLINKNIWEILKQDSAKALELINADRGLKLAFEEHIKTYSWIQIHSFLGKDILVEDLIEQMTHLETQSQNAEQEIPDGFKFFSEMASKISYLRQAGAEYSSVNGQIVLPRLKKIAASLNLGYRELLDMEPQEIIDAINGKFNAQTAVEARQGENWCIYADGDSHAIIVHDPETVKELAAKMIPQHKGDGNTIKGQIGNKGVATGRAKVILGNLEFDKLKPGDVLVTTMTTPDFVILMQKSCAIVTDIGGMLCHAAIMSRELGKPCIIGTKHATKILKDGDLIEVDANRGIVKIINP
jgi:phosphoenolpyruvate synthase/pyruvate phosphate dikinase